MYDLHNELKNKVICITGASGYIGSSLVKELDSNERVDRIEVHNNSFYDLLLLSGDIIEGAKQNRMIMDNIIIKNKLIYKKLHTTVLPLRTVPTNLKTFNITQYSRHYRGF